MTTTPPAPSAADAPDAPLLHRVTPEQVERQACTPVDAATLDAARRMLDDIAQRREAAVFDLSYRLGDLRPGESAVRTRRDLRAALDALPADQRALLERTAARIDAFARAQRACLRDLTLAIPGGEAGHTFIPVTSAGCYAPGGRFPLPSSVLMTALTARAAGVRDVWVASPRPTPVTLAAAAIAGAEGVLAIGGVQAVASLAWGLLGLPRCDIIVGPGNRWVTAAKQLVSVETGIDMLAGPSELLVLADDSPDPALIAADLLAQAEHDDDAVPTLVTTSAALIETVERELRRQLETLLTAPTARAALGNGRAVLASTLDEAIRVVDRLAPEHLEILTRDAHAVARRISNAGAIFIGPGAAEVLGDYGAGPNHVLPTGGTARFRAGLSVLTFLRARTWMRVDDPAAATPLARDASALARLELLEGHARAAELRTQ
jgi:phosphoribosyl-ATP pyrophosphohydrolase/phosphoribosyl-AMP cyclohydrolase/histidinol dehydrogenase